MTNKFFKVLSLFLVAIMVFQLLPANMAAFAANSINTAESADTIQSTGLHTGYKRLQTAQIVEEDISKRGQYYKEFVLNNGLRMATLYPYAVHYEKDGQWEEIDNTLVVSGDNYMNTAGEWSVSFPKSMNRNTAVSIQKDGYTLRFYMAGELRNNGNQLERASVEASGGENLSVQSVQTATAQIAKVDNGNLKAELEHPEMFSEKTQSRLQYANVHSGTNIVYDLDSNRVKESIVMQAYSAGLWGYRYTLDVGELNPVLTDSGEIHLYDRDNKEIVMVMPAPFLVDDAGEYNYDVNVTLTGSGSSYTLTYLLPQDWMSSSDRQWPVVLDPAVDADTTRSNIRDVSVYERNCPEDYNSGILEVGHHTDYGIMRAFLKYDELPALTSADVVVNAELALCKPNNSNRSNPIEIHKVTETWESETTTWANQPDINSTVEDYAIVQNVAWYNWSITDVVRGWYESGNTGLALTAPDWVESTSSTLSYRKQFYSSDYSSQYRPILRITFRNNNGLESYWDYTASSAGRAGTGYINNFTGNLVWSHSDIGYGGNRMPVSISHIYNANDATPRVAEDSPDRPADDAERNAFGMGYGWRTNFNQTIDTRTLSLMEDGAMVSKLYYVWEDSDGTEHYFYKTDDGTYQDEDGLDLTLTLQNNGLACTITDKQDNTSYFDSKGRLYKLENNQETKSSISITYTTTTGKLINTVTDGAGRVYQYVYSNGLLSRIKYKGTGSTEIGYLTFSYTNKCLTGVTYQDGETVTYTYNADRVLTSAQDIDGYCLSYTYHSVTDSSWQPYRVKTVSETDGSANGGTLTITYGQNQTTFTDHNGNVQIMQFNNWGNTVTIQDGEGRGQFATYAAPEEASGKGNQLSAASKLQNTVSSQLRENSFEGGEYWENITTNTTHSVSTSHAYLGEYSLCVVISTAGTNGVYSNSFTVGKGETWTFSAYVKTTGGMTAYLALAEGATVLAKSDPIKANTNWTRLEVSYTNDTSASKTIRAQLMSNTAGTVYMDCTQVEATETASRYNLIEDGDFCYSSSYWSMSQYCDSNETVVTTTDKATPLLSGDAFQIVGDPEHKLRIRQEVVVSGVKNDAFVLAGWAKGNGVPLTNYTDDVRTFTIRGAFLYTDGDTGEFNFHFNPETTDWQYAAGVMVAEKAYEGIKIQVLYDFNANDVLFDGIQLFKEEFGNSYEYYTDGSVKSVTDIQAQKTTYEYKNNNLTEMTLPTGVVLTYDYDICHNVEMATTAEGVVYTFEYDTWGNNTRVSIKSGNSTITSTAEYSDDGNRLVSTTDALGKTTTYGYNANTNILEWVQSPKDTEQTRTEYTYDNMYRLASAAVTTDTGTALSVQYTYEDDLLTKLETESTTYTFAYGDFALRSSIKIGSRTLAEYDYTNDRNNYLSALDYGNEDRVEYTYDKQGRLVTQTYEDGDTVTYKYDNNGALATVIDSATGVSTKYYYDFTERLMKYVESGEDYSHSVAYTYDLMNNLTGVVETINGTEFTSTYGYNTDNVLTSVTNGAGSWNFGYDTYGRLIEINGGAFNRTYYYHTSTESKPTAQLSSISYPSSLTGQTYSYTYDDNGNILTASFGSDTFSYVYDSQNQLIRENNSRLGCTYTWSYDNAGNILSRSTYAYTTGELGSPTSVIQYSYEDLSWGDLVTQIGSNAITYDEIGNMLTFGARSFTWEHGRQLASQTVNGSTWTYTYNTDGMRTSRTNGTNSYEYIYNGSQLMRMVRNGVVVDFTYINGIPATISFNGNTFYYVVNGQGDVTGITDSDGNLQLSYYYDAWGTPYYIYATGNTYGSTLLTINPIMYRGYVFDRELGMYYLQSRYYIPQIARFLNADGYTSTGQGLIGNNMFAYCLNNPIIFDDTSGHFPSLSDVANFFKDCVKTISATTKKIAKVGESFVKNVEFSAGVGMGLFGKGEILDTGVDAGMYVTNVSFMYQDGEWGIGQESFAGITSSLLGSEFGAATSGTRIGDGEWQNQEWFIYNYHQESWTLFDVGLYAGPGATVRVGFDLNTFLHDWDDIWG